MAGVVITFSNFYKLYNFFFHECYIQSANATAAKLTASMPRETYRGKEQGKSEGTIRPLEKQWRMEFCQYFL